MSSALRNISRKSDVICRFGGEEFIVLFPDTNIKNASYIAQKIKKHIEKLEIKTNNKVIHCTISIGLAEVNIDKDENVEIAVKKADDALYIAKKSGKNKVCIRDKGENICLPD